MRSYCTRNCKRSTIYEHVLFRLNSVFFYRDGHFDQEDDVGCTVMQFTFFFFKSLNVRLSRHADVHLTVDWQDKNDVTFQSLVYKLQICYKLHNKTNDCIDAKILNFWSFTILWRLVENFLLRPCSTFQKRERTRHP